MPIRDDRPPASKRGLRDAMVGGWLFRMRVDGRRGCYEITMTSLLISRLDRGHGNAHTRGCYHHHYECFPETFYGTSLSVFGLTSRHFMLTEQPGTYPPITAFPEYEVQLHNICSQGHRSMYIRPVQVQCYSIRHVSSA